ncbi:MAG TPA: ABC transporter permease subunit, partial [Actinomycetota bacterium]
MNPRLGQQEDVATVDVPESERAVETIPSREPLTPLDWLKVNLFPSPVNGVLTVLTAILTGWLTFAVLRWVLVTADWTVVRVNFRLFMVGRFPLEEVWRVWSVVYVAALLVGVTWGRTGRRMEWTRLKTIRRIVLGILGLLLLRYLVDSALVWGLTAAAAGTVLAGTALGRLAGRESRVMRRAVLWGWLLAFPFVIVILQVADGVGPALWNGLLLNVLAGVVGIVLSFPIGIVLALGRRSTFPAVRVVCVGLIEFVRGAPLYTWLLFGVFLLPFLLPPGVILPQLIRVMIMFTLFSSAYVAEIVRGGLQGVHHGQYEAARALGL